MALLAEDTKEAGAILHELSGCEKIPRVHCKNPEWQPNNGGWVQVVHYTCYHCGYDYTEEYLGKPKHPHASPR